MRFKWVVMTLPLAFVLEITFWYMKTVKIHNLFFNLLLFHDYNLVHRICMWLGLWLLFAFCLVRWFVEWLILFHSTDCGGLLLLTKVSAVFKIAYDLQEWCAKNKLNRSKVRFQQRTGSRSYIAHAHVIVIIILPTGACLYSYLTYYSKVITCNGLLIF